MDELNNLFESYGGKYGLGNCGAGDKCINIEGISLTSHCFHYDRNGNPNAKYTCEYCNLTIHPSCIFPLRSIHNNLVCYKCGSETMTLPSKLKETQSNKSKSVNGRTEIDSLLVEEIITDPAEGQWCKSLWTMEDDTFESVNESNKKNNNSKKSNNNDTDAIVNHHREQFEISVFGTVLSSVNSQGNDMVKLKSHMVLI